MTSILKNKAALLFIVMGMFFISNALIAEFIGVKIFAVEDTLGIEPFNWDLFGHQGSLMLSAGVLPWLIVFVMTDIVNEYYGKRGVKLLSYISVGLIAYAFLIIFGAIYLTPAGFWVSSYQEKGVEDAQAAFSVIYGQGAWIIVGSIIAFLVGQLIDALVFHRLRKWTGDRLIWLRATGSTVVSQLIDSFVVLYIAFVIGADWSLSQFFAVGTVNYSYKFFVAILLTPIIYLAHYTIDWYLGKDLSEALRQRAVSS